MPNAIRRHTEVNDSSTPFQGVILTTLILSAAESYFRIAFLISSTLATAFFVSGLSDP
jgi:hypothetical protein